MVPPMTTAVADHTPRPRTKSGAFEALWVCMVTSQRSVLARIQLGFVNYHRMCAPSVPRASVDFGLADRTGERVRICLSVVNSGDMTGYLEAIRSRGLVSLTER
jgi:hypothetical protein